MNKSTQYGAHLYSMEQLRKERKKKLIQWISDNTIQSMQCEKCKGSGKGGFFSSYCRKCAGSGFIPTVICPKCAGAGKGLIFKCGLCDGDGKTNSWSSLRSYFDA